MTTKQNFKRSTLFVFMALFVFNGKIYSLPEYADQEDRDCSFCHFDPDGGGARNPIGQVFEKNDFEFPEDFDPESIIAKAEEKSRNFTLSGNVRTAYIHPIEPEKSPGKTPGCNSCHASTNTFFLMKGELTANFQPSDRVTLTISNSMGVLRDLFGTIELIPEKLRLKIGEFELPFGPKKPNDHNILLREGYGIKSNVRDLGVSISGKHEAFSYNFTVFNGNPSLIPNQDNNSHKGILTSIGTTIGSVNGGISYLSDKPGDRQETTIGTFATVNRGKFSLRGEFDFQTIDKFDSIESKGYYVDLKFRPKPNLSIATRYGLFDPDRKIKGDAKKRITLTGRYRFDPNASVEAYYWHNFDSNDQIILMSSFWF